MADLLGLNLEVCARTRSVDTFSKLEPDNVRLAKTASRSTLGFMTEMAFELGWIISDGAASAAATPTHSTTRSAGCSGTAATTSGRSTSSFDASTLKPDRLKSGANLADGPRSGVTSIAQFRRPSI